MKWNRTICAAAAVSVALACVLAVTAAPSVVYAERYEKVTPRDASDRLDRAEHDVHAVRDLLRHSEIKEQPGLLGKISGLFTGKPHEDAPSKVGQAFDSAKASVGRAFTSDQYDQAMHKLKVAFGVEQSTAWEKIRTYFGADRYSSVGDQFRHAFGYEPATEEGFFQKIGHALSGESESTFTKARRALGMESESTAGELWHKIKTGLGAEDPTLLERIRGAFEPHWSDRVMHPMSSNTELFMNRIKESIGSLDPRHQDTVMEKIKKAVGLQEPGMVERLRDRYSTGLQETLETGAHMTQAVADSAVEKAKDYLEGSTYDNVLHRIKMAVGAEDPTVWETIQTALSHPDSLKQRVADWMGIGGLTRQDLMARVSESLNNLDPRKRESTLQKVKNAIGWSEPSTLDKARDSVGDTAQRAVDTAAELLSGTSFDDVMHRVKAAVGAEDSTVWETIQSAMSTRESVGDKVRHFFGRDRGVTRTDLFEKIKNSIPQASRRDSTLEKIKKAVGLEEPSLMDKIRDRIGGQSIEGLLSSTDLQDLAHRAKVAIGVDDPTTWESIKSAFEYQPGIYDKVKNAISGRSGTTREEIYERVRDSLAQMDPRRRDTILEKIKKAVGMQEPGLMDRVKAGLSSIGHTVERKSEEAGDMANELLQGNSYDEAIHKVKVALGQEDPTIWERVSDAWHPSSSIGDKLRHVLGRDTDKGVTRNSLLQRAESALESFKPDQREGVMRKIKVALGLERPGLIGRAQEGISHLFGRDQPMKTGTSIDKALEAFRASTEGNREEAYKKLREALEDARLDMREKATSLYEMVGGHRGESKIGHTFRDIEHKFQDMYDALLGTARSWKDDVSQFVKTGGRGNSYLFESFKEENGLSLHYVNDNGQEFLDATGSNADERKFDKLRALNTFRDEFNLKPHDDLPKNASVQVHTVHRPHVLIKSSRIVDRNRYDYCYDDGKETLSVDWHDRGFQEKRLDPDLQHRLLTEFREMHGLALPVEHEPSHVRGNIRRFREDL